jgi:ABC-type branched-subunit amino acid transport system permease subunit
LTVQFFGENPRGATTIFPFGGISVLGTHVAWNQLADLAAAAVIILGLEAFQRYTRVGLLTRALAEDQSMAVVLGAKRGRIGALNWMIAAGIAGLAGVLIAPLAPFTADGFFSYFVLGLVASLLGGLQSLALAGLGGLLVGVIYNVVGIKIVSVSSGDLAVFLIATAYVLIRKRWPSEVTKLVWARPAGAVENNPAIAAMIQRSLFGSVVWSQTAATILVYALAAASLMPVIGWTGQVSLAAGGLMGIGAYVMTDALNYYHLAFPLAVLMGVVAGTVAGALVGLVTKRLAFVLTAVVTLAFTDACAWLFNNSPLFHTVSGSADLNLPSWLGTNDDRLLMAALFAAVGMAALWSLKRSSWGLKFAAVKSGPVMAEHFGVSTGRARTYAFAVSGGLASLAGIGFATTLQSVGPTDFGNGLSLQVLLFAVAGGVTMLAGPFLSTVGFVGIPQLIGLAKYGALAWPNLLSGVANVGLLSRMADGLVSTIRKRPPVGKPGGIGSSEPNSQSAASSHSEAAAEVDSSVRS